MSTKIETHPTLLPQPDTLTEAQSPSSPAIFRTGHVAAIATTHAIHDTYSAFLAPLLPVFIANLSLSNTLAGMLSFFTQFPSIVQPLFGYLADRSGLRLLVILAPTVTAAGMSLLGLAPTYAILAFMLIIVGISSAGIHAVGPVIAGRLSGAKLGKGMSFWMVGGEFGRTLGPLVVVTALQFLTLRQLPWLMILGPISSLLLYLRLRDVPDHTPLPATPGFQWTAVRGMARFMVPLAGILLARACLFSAVGVYLPVFMTGEGADLWLAGASLSVMEIAGVAGALLSGSLSDRLGRRRIMAASLLATPLAMFVFLNVQQVAQIVALLALGFCLLSLTPVVMASVQETFPSNRALANGVYMLVSHLISAVAVVVVGVMGDLLGLRQAFTLSAFFMLLGLPLVLLLPKKPSQPRTLITNGTNAVE